MSTTIYLTERNLRTLLSKLERKKMGEETQCTLIKYQQASDMFKQTVKEAIIVAVLDEEYYPAMERPPGEVHPLDEPK